MLLEERFEAARTIAGTQKLHSLVPINICDLEVRAFSEISTKRVVSVARIECSLTEVMSIAGYFAVEYNEEWWLALIIGNLTGTNYCNWKNIYID